MFPHATTPKHIILPGKWDPWRLGDEEEESKVGMNIPKKTKRTGIK